MHPTLVRKVWVSFAWRFLLWVWFNLIVARFALDALLEYFGCPQKLISATHPILESGIVLFTSYWALRWALKARIKLFNETV